MVPEIPVLYSSNRNREFPGSFDIGEAESAFRITCGGHSKIGVQLKAETPVPKMGGTSGSVVRWSHHFADTFHPGKLSFGAHPLL